MSEMRGVRAAETPWCIANARAAGQPGTLDLGDFLEPIIRDTSVDENCGLQKAARELAFTFSFPIVLNNAGSFRSVEPLWWYLHSHVAYRFMSDFIPYNSVNSRMLVDLIERDPAEAGRQMAAVGNTAWFKFEVVAGAPEGFHFSRNTDRMGRFKATVYWLFDKTGVSNINDVDKVLKSRAEAVMRGLRGTVKPTDRVLDCLVEPGPLHQLEDRKIAEMVGKAEALMREQSPATFHMLLKKPGGEANVLRMAEWRTDAEDGRPPYASPGTLAAAWGYATVNQIPSHRLQRTVYDRHLHDRVLPEVRKLVEAAADAVRNEYIFLCTREIQRKTKMETGRNAVNTVNAFNLGATVNLLQYSSACRRIGRLSARLKDDEGSFSHVAAEPTWRACVAQAVINERALLESRIQLLWEENKRLLLDVPGALENMPPAWLNNILDDADAAEEHFRERVAGMPLGNTTLGEVERWRREEHQCANGLNVMPSRQECWAEMDAFIVDPVLGKVDAMATLVSALAGQNHDGLLARKEAEHRADPRRPAETEEREHPDKQVRDSHRTMRVIRRVREFEVRDLRNQLVMELNAGTTDSDRMFIEVQVRLALAGGELAALGVRRSSLENCVFAPAEGQAFEHGWALDAVRGEIAMLNARIVSLDSELHALRSRPVPDEGDRVRNHVNNMRKHVDDIISLIHRAEALMRQGVNELPLGETTVAQMELLREEAFSGLRRWAEERRRGPT